MSARVAVIGANGYVGKHLSNALNEQGINVLKLSSNDGSGINCETGLFSNDFKFPSGVEAVFFLAQSPLYRQIPDHSAHVLSVNCVSAVQAVEAARRAGVKRFIYASTGNVYKPSFLPFSEDDPVRQDNWYALSKVMAEKALALYRSDLDITVARIFGVYGPNQKDKLVPMIADKIKAGMEIFLDKNFEDSEDKNGLSISLMYIDDLVHAFIRLISVKNCEYINLAGLEAVSIRALVSELASCFKMPFRISLSDKNVRFSNLIADISLQKREVLTPSISLSEGIKRFCHVMAEKL